MLFKGQFIQRKKKPIWIIVILVVFFMLSMIFELKSNNTKETAKLMLCVASNVEQITRRRAFKLVQPNGKNFKVSNCCNQGIYFPSAINSPNSSTTPIQNI